MCLTPINVKGKRRSDNDYLYNSVPCGKCPKCRQRRINAWVFRLLQEEKVHVSSLFITLTYAPENLHLTTNGLPTLDKSDFQKFMKRLRKNTGIKSIKYYVCGEYGTKTFRPHYHAIIFDVSGAAIDTAWRLGAIHIGDVSGASIAYTAKYIDKPSKIPAFELDDRLPEFSLMSKGMGKNYLTPAAVRWHKENEASRLVLPDGIIQAMPRYYRDKVFTPEEKLKLNAIVKGQYDKKFEQNVKYYCKCEKKPCTCGSLAEYYRNAYEGVKQIFNQSKYAEGRDKI